MSHRRKIEDKRRLRNLYLKTYNSMGGGVFEYRGRYIRWYPYSSNFNRAKYYRRQANRRVRRNDTPLNRGQYKKLYEVRWAIY